MSYKFTHNSELHILELIIEGEYGFSDAKQLIADAIEWVKKYNCYKVLADVRNAKLRLSIIDFYEAPQIIANLFKTVDIPISKLKRAVVITKGTRNVDFLETVVANRGQTMKLFHDIDEAKEWLLK